jgi:hypothetical protein
MKIKCLGMKMLVIHGDEPENTVVIFINGENTRDAQ